MKKKLLFCLILFVITMCTVGCQKKNAEMGGTENDTQIVGEAKTGEDSSNSEADNSGADDADIIYNIEEYGAVTETTREYLVNGTEIVAYYYTLENFYFDDSLTNAALINHTLQQIYDEYEQGYVDAAVGYDSDDYMDIPFSQWHILSLPFVGDDYVSILYNDISYMGGAHPYSRYDGITIDCRTGEQVMASQLLGKSDEEILADVSNVMGLEGICTWEDVDFYLTDSSVVFFYRVPGFWEDVHWPRP